MRTMQLDGELRCSAHPIQVTILRAEAARGLQWNVDAL
jgi:hypothetical protein